MAIDSFSKFLIEIGVDQASWNDIVKKFTTLRRTEKQLEKDFIKFGQINKKVWADSSQAIRAYNVHLSKTLLLTQQLKRVMGVGSGLTNRIAASRKLLPTGRQALTPLNVHQVANVRGVGPKKAQAIMRQIVADDAVGKFFERTYRETGKQWAQEAEKQRKQVSAKQKRYQSFFSQWGKTQPGAYAGETYYGNKKFEVGTTRGQPFSVADHWKRPDYSGASRPRQIQGATGNEMAAQLQAAEKLYGTKQKIATSNKAQVDSTKQMSEIDQKVLQLNDQIRKQKGLAEIYTKRATQNLKSNADISHRNSLKAINTEGKLTSLQNKRKNLLIEQGNLARTVARAFPDKDLTAAAEKLDKLRAGLGAIERTTKSDTVRKRVQGIQKDLDTVETGLGTARSQKEFDALNKKIKDGTKSLKEFESGHKTMSKNVGRRQGLLNTKFGSFSIIMSGMAATIFVMQQVIQGVRALLAPTLDIEKAWKDLATTFIGSREEMESFFNKAKSVNLTGFMKTGEAVKELEAFKAAGYTAQEAIIALEIKLEIAAKNEGPIDKFIRKMTAFWRSMMTPEGFKPDSIEIIEQQNKVLKQNLKNPNRDKAFKVGYLSPWRREKFVTTQQSDRIFQGQNTFSSPSQPAPPVPIFTGPQQKWGPLDGKWFNSLEEYNQYRLNREAGKSALSKFSSMTGRQAPGSKGFYEDMRRQQMDTMKLMAPEAADEFGAFLDDEEFRKNAQTRIQAEKSIYESLGKLTKQYYEDQRALIEIEERKDAGLMGLKDAAKIAAKKQFNLDLEMEKAAFLKMSPGVQEKQEKLRSEYKIVTPGMKKIWEWERIERDKRASNTRSGQPRDPVTQAIIEQADLIKTYKQSTETKIAIEKRYYDESKIMSLELFKDKKWYIIEESNLLMKQGLDRIRAVEIANERYRQLKREQAAGMAVAIAQGSTPTEGMQARIKQLEATSETVAQQWQQRWGEMIDGTEQSVHGFFYTFFQDENKSLSDSFKSLGDTFKQMVDKMASDIITSGLMKALFGNTYDGNVSGGGISGIVKSWVGGGGGGGGTWTPGPVETAKGNVFAFAKGGILNSPTAFRLGAGGVGIAGEAGYEAIMPVKRMASGNLGVQGTQPNVNVTVINNTDQKAKVSETKGPDNTRQIIVSVGSGDIANGGLMAKTLERTYGLRRIPRRI